MVEQTKEVAEQAQHNLLDRIDKMSIILSAKGHDYGMDNFIEAALIASLMLGKEVTPDMVVACLIGVKIARIGNLNKKDVSPKNESFEDTIIDLANYIQLYARENERYLTINEKYNR
jgi:hypothetical protein